MPYREQTLLRRSAYSDPANGNTKQQVSLATKKTEQEIPGYRKRLREQEDSLSDIAEISAKRLRVSADITAARPDDQKNQFDNSEASVDPIDYWRNNRIWPKEYFEPDTTSHLLRKKPAAFLRRKRSDSGSLAASSTTPSDQKPRDEKSAPYRDNRYNILLATKGSHMGKYVGDNEKDITKDSEDIYRTLLETEQVIPKDSIFEDDFFEDTCEMLQNRNEAKVIQDISRLIVPSAQSLAIRSAKDGPKHLRYLIESVNEGWNNSVPLTGTRPQPDYSVGFKRNAFTEEQRNKLAPFIGDFLFGDQSFFMATCYMYFPFLSCEVKCGNSALDIADRQNAHSMTLAVRAVVELFRLVKREKEIHREILAFSVSHDHESVRIYGHYAAIDGPKTEFYRHPIRRLNFQDLNGKDKWTTYKFIKSIYDIWVPTHFKRLCSALDDLPADIDFDVASLPQDSRLSQGLESHHLSHSFSESASQTGDDSHSNIGVVSPDTSFTQVSKRQRGNSAK
ncbi:hypothetical protein ACMFMG_007586 [Clarireedia jacksonii]